MTILLLFLILARTTPFRIGVYTNMDENLGEGLVAVDAVVGVANTNEASPGVAQGVGTVGMLQPLGTQGFSLGFSQIGC